MGVLELDFGPTESLAAVLKELTGVVVPPHKSYLFQQRLASLFVEHGLDSYDALARGLRTNPTMRRAFVHAMTTHETSFFRDGHPFENLRREILPALLWEVAARQRAGRPPNAFTVWSAAASSGKEVYTLAMLIDEVVESNPQWGLDPNRIRLLGTDISEPVLEEARKGSYGRGEGLRGLPSSYRDRYLQEKDGVFHVAPSLKRRCTFRQLDLTKQFTLGPFDLVLARNVLIYFDGPTKTKTLERIQETLVRGGVLMLGSSESLEPGAVHLFRSALAGRTRYFAKIAGP